MNTLTAPVKDVVMKIDPIPAPPPIESDGSLGQELAKWGHGLAAGLRDGMGAGAGNMPVTMPRGVKEARDRVADWWSGDRVDKVAEVILSNERRELDALIADGTFSSHLHLPPHLPAHLPRLWFLLLSPPALFFSPTAPSPTHSCPRTKVGASIHAARPDNLRLRKGK